MGNGMRGAYRSHVYCKIKWAFFVWEDEVRAGMLTLPAAMKLFCNREVTIYAATKGTLIGVKMLFNLNCYRYARLLSNYIESYSLYVIYEKYCT